MLNKEKIKEYIYSKDELISKSAVQYFNESYSKDEEIMKIVLDCYKDHSQKNIRAILANSDKLVINEESFTRIINRIKGKSINNDMYEKIILNSPIELLEKYWEELRGILTNDKGYVELRLDLRNMESEELIKELKKFSKENNDKYINEFNFKCGELIAKELSGRCDLEVEEIIKDIKNVDFINEYGTYYEGYLTYFLGELRYEPSIPYLVGMLGSDGDLFNEEALKALCKIGSNEVVKCIVEKFHNGTWDFKLYASSVFNAIKTDYCEKEVSELLKKEKSIDIKTKLASSLCEMFSLSKEDYIKDMVIKEEYDSSMLDLRESLYINYIINEIEFEEKDLWKKEIEEERLRIEERLSGFFGAGIFQKVAAEKVIKVGRNDPCTCGSGKKYKKCCGK